MIIRLYKTKTPTKENLNKTLTNEKEIDNVVFLKKKYFDVLNPTLILNGFNNMDSFLTLNGYNMLYIPKLKRYYFLDKMFYENEYLHINCSCDSLYTFRQSIKNSTQYIGRQQTKSNKYLVDSSLPIHSDNKYLVRAFGVPVIDKYCNRAILETAGYPQEVNNNG